MSIRVDGNEKNHYNFPEHFSHRNLSPTFLEDDSRICVGKIFGNQIFELKKKEQKTKKNQFNDYDQFRCYVIFL